jgi:hypothetical protein
MDSGVSGSAHLVAVMSTFTEVVSVLGRKSPHGFGSLGGILLKLLLSWLFWELAHVLEIGIADSLQLLKFQPLNFLFFLGFLGLLSLSARSVISLDAFSVFPSCLSEDNPLMLLLLGFLLLFSVLSDHQSVVLRLFYVEPALAGQLVHLLFAFFSLSYLLSLEFLVFLLVISNGLEIDFSLFKAFLHGSHSVLHQVAIGLSLLFVQLLEQLFLGFQFCHFEFFVLELFLPLCPLLCQLLQLLSSFFFSDFCFVLPMPFLQLLFFSLHILHPLLVLSGLFLETLFEFPLLFFQFS